MSFLKQNLCLLLFFHPFTPFPLLSPPLPLSWGLLSNFLGYIHLNTLIYIHKHVEAASISSSCPVLTAMAVPMLVTEGVRILTTDPHETVLAHRGLQNHLQTTAYHILMYLGLAELNMGKRQKPLLLMSFLLSFSGFCKLSTTFRLCNQWLCLRKWNRGLLVCFILFFFPLAYLCVFLSIYLFMCAFFEKTFISAWPARNFFIFFIFSVGLCLIFLVALG